LEPWLSIHNETTTDDDVVVVVELEVVVDAGEAVVGEVVVEVEGAEEEEAEVVEVANNTSHKRKRPTRFFSGERMNYDCSIGSRVNRTPLGTGIVN